MRPDHGFEIAFVGLKDGVHEFSYNIDDQFFARYSQPDFSNSHLQILLRMDKKSNFFLLKFEITGAVTVNCDRCGEPFVLNVWDEFPLVVKRVSDPASTEDDPDVAYISQHESILNVAGWVYEFALLSIPMQRVHPNDKDGNSACNPIVLKMLDNMKQGNESKQNLIWKDLDQFRNLQK